MFVLEAVVISFFREKKYVHGFKPDVLKRLATGESAQHHRTNLLYLSNLKKERKKAVIHVSMVGGMFHSTARYHLKFARALQSIPQCLRNTLTTPKCENPTWLNNFKPNPIIKTVQNGEFFLKYTTL